jgi:hypothetical protein
MVIRAVAIACAFRPPRSSSAALANPNVVH